MREEINEIFMFCNNKLFVLEQSQNIASFKDKNITMFIFQRIKAQQMVN